MNSIYIISSPFCLKNEHLTFEAGILELIYNLGNWKIIFVWNNNHITSLQTLISDLPISYYPLSSENRIFLWLQVIFSTFFLHFFNKKRKVLFLSFEHPNIVFLIALLFRDSVGFLHTYWAKNIFLSSIKKIWYKLYLLRNQSVVLWKWIYENMPPHKNHFYIYHPIPYFVSSFRAKEKKNQVVIFPSRSYRFNNRDAADSFVGQIESHGLGIVSLWWPNRTLKVDDYYSQLAQSQFCVLLSSAKDYSLRCSGSLFDALGLWVFVYGIESDMSRSLSRDFWSIGFFASNYDELNNALGKIHLLKHKQTNFWELIFEKNIILISKILD